MKLPPLNFPVPQEFVEQALDARRAELVGASWSFTNKRPPIGLNATIAVDEATIIDAIIHAVKKTVVRPEYEHFAVSFTSARGDEGIQAHITASVDPIEGGTRVEEQQEVPAEIIEAQEVATNKAAPEPTAVAAAEPVLQDTATEASPFAQAATQTTPATTLADVMAAEAADDDTRVPEAGALFSAAIAEDEPGVEAAVQAGGIFAGFTKPDNSAGE